MGKESAPSKFVDASPAERCILGTLKKLQKNARFAQAKKMQLVDFFLICIKIKFMKTF